MSLARTLALVVFAPIFAQGCTMNAADHSDDPAREGENGAAVSKTPKQVFDDIKAVT